MDGHIEIFVAGSDTKYISYQDWSGNKNPFKIPIPADGRVVVLADPSLTYDVYVYDSFNNLASSRANVQCNVPGTINLSGADTRIQNSDGTLDISLQTSANNVRVYTINSRNKLLDVQEPLYFVENSESATVIGFSGDDYATKDYVDAAVSGKLDISAISSVSADWNEVSAKVDTTAYNDDITVINNNISAISADVSGKMDVSKLEYNENGEISAYDGSAFAGQGGAGDPEVNDLVHAQSGAWNEVSAKLDASAFSSISGDFTTTADLAFYQTISGMTAYQLSGDYATNTDLQAVSAEVSGKQDAITILPIVAGDNITITESADQIVIGSNITGSDFVERDELSAYQKVDDMSAYQPSGDYATTADLAFYQPVSAMTAYQSAGNYASADDLTAYQPVSAMTAYQQTGDYVVRDDLTAYQPVGDYVITDDLTAYQPAGNYAYASALNNKVDVSSYTAFSSNVTNQITELSGIVSGDYELSAGQYIGLTDYPAEHKTVVSVTGQSGLFQAQYGVTPYSAIRQAVEDHKVVYCQSGGRMAFLAFSGNTNYEFQYYRSIAGHNYANQGDQVFVYTIANNNTWTVGTRNAYTQMIPSAGLTSAITTGNSAKLTFAVDSNIINAASAVSANSAAWADHSVTTNSTLSGTGTVASPLGIVPGYNETVLYEDTDYQYGRDSVTLSEDYRNFEYIKIFNSKGNVQLYYPDNAQGVKIITLSHTTNVYMWLIPWTFANNGLTFSGATGKIWTIGTTTVDSIPSTAANNRWIQPTKIIGVNRKV